MRSPQMFAHDTTAVLSHHFQTSVVIKALEFRRVGYGQVIGTLDSTVGAEMCPWVSEAHIRNWAPTCEAIRSYLEFTLLQVHRDMFSCLLHKKLMVAYV